MVLDVLKPLQHKRLLEHELEGFGIRLNKEPPNIFFRKKDKGGINFQSLVPLTELDKDTVKTILNEYKIHNADITFRCDATAEDLIDIIEGNRVYIPCIYVLNKIDQISIEELDIICKLVFWILCSYLNVVSSLVNVSWTFYRVPHCVPISAHHKWNFDELLEKMWDYLSLVRIYTKPKSQLPDYTSPVILKSTAHTVEDFCNKIHRSIIKEFK